MQAFCERVPLFRRGDVCGVQEVVALASLHLRGAWPNPEVRLPLRSMRSHEDAYRGAPLVQPRDRRVPLSRVLGSGDDADGDCAHVP